MSFLRLAFCIGIMIPTVCCGQASDKSALLVKPTEDFEITGDSSAAWNKTFWITLPSRGGTKVYLTKIKLLYSTIGIYCLFYCEDEKITSTLREDFSNLFLEDVVEAFFWTDEAKPLYFEYELSPHNYELPILVPNDKGNFFGWLPWHYEGDRRTRHATRRNAKSWTAEFFIPFALLKPLGNVPPTKGMRWRANLYRLDYDEGISKWSWQLTGPSFHEIEKFGTLLFE